MSRRCARLIVLAVLAGGCGSSSHPVTSTRKTTTTSTPAPAAVASTLRAPRPQHHHRPHRRQPGPAPGTLPQTHRLPSSHTAAFHAEMRALWGGITTGSARPALPAFFPEAAYAQVKAIVNPSADYARRLRSDFALDVAAAHALLGRGARRARLLAVRVPAGFAHWVTAGVCLNRIGYWEVPNARLVYDQGGQTRSIGIASMISWRGVWYVVHLGAVVRQTSGGVVDDPSEGPGESAASTTC